MTSVFYIIAILLIGAGAVVSFMNFDKHKKLTKETFETRGTNDQLLEDIRLHSGKYLKAEEIADQGDRVGDKPEKAVQLITQRTLTGQTDALNFIPAVDRIPVEGEEAPDTSPYQKEVDGVPLMFKPYNQALAANAEEPDQGQIAFIQSLPITEPEAKGKRAGAKAVLSTLQSYVDETVAGEITRLNGNITSSTSTKDSLTSDIKEYVDAEKKIEEMFKSEGIDTLQGGKDKLVSLEKTRKEKIDIEDTLTKEKSTLTEKRTKNTNKLSNHAEYFAKRKVSIDSNQKKFALSAVDFEWGFAVVKTDPDTKFFVNQRLTVIRGTHFLGEVVVSTVEPGRVMANIDYDSIQHGHRFRKGDKVILANPAEQ